MKFKITADSKDLTIFAVYAVALLLLVALAVINLPYLASEGEFYGLNPLPAFAPDKIYITLVIYIVCLIGSFFTVQSHFFEFENGVGFGITNGATGGYSDWAKEKDIKNDNNVVRVEASAKTSDAAGVPLICNGKELWVDNGEYHTLVIGATGSGKTQDTILPTIKVLAKKGESIVCTDPKGELFEKTGGLLKSKGYNILLLNFRNPQNGESWNPLSMPYRLYKSGNQDKAIELLDDLAANILYEENSGNQDPFWEKTAADYFAGIALAMFEDTTEDKININSINMTATVGEDKIGGSTYIKEYFNMKDPSSPAYVNASGTVMAPSDTKGSIISVFKQKVKLFASRENLSEMLSHSDIDLDSIGKQKTAVFIIIQDEKKTYHSLATIFIKQVYETLIDVAQANGGKLPVRTNFLLDEFANMPPLKDVTTMITAARSRQVRFVMIIQNYAQLNKVYGKDDAETIKGNCGNIIYLISTELAALEEISKLCGEKKSKKDAKTASTPLVTINDLQRMKQFDHIVLRMRKSPFKTSFVPDFKIDWGEKSEAVEYPVREKRPVAIFDIREFVKEQKNKKVDEIMNNLDNPGGPSGRGGGSGLFPPSKPSPKNNNDNYVNDLVRKIDERLAELEKEDEMKNRMSKPEIDRKPGNNHLPPMPVPYEPRDKVKDKAPDIKIDTDDLLSKINKKLAEESKKEEMAKKNSIIEDRTVYDDPYKEPRHDAYEPRDNRDRIERKPEPLFDDIPEAKYTPAHPEPRMPETYKNEPRHDNKYEDIINNSDIEHKVNEKLNSEILGSDFDLLSPIEKNTNNTNDYKYTYEERNNNNDKENYEAREPVVENNNINNNRIENFVPSNEKIFDDQRKVTLDEIEEDEEFFDDFFDD